MNNTLKFSVDKMELIEEVNKSQFARIKLFAFSSGNNAHDRPVSEETLKRSAYTIYQKPLVWFYDKYTDDAEGHNPLEIPCGFVHKEDNPIDFVRLEDGRLMLTVEAMIWKRYSGKILSLFERDGMEKPVSVEIQILEEKENEDGKMEIVDLCYMAITILGTFVTPAIKSAKAEILEFSNAKQEYNNSLTYKIPEIVKQNAQKGILFKKNNSKGATAVNLSIANQLINNDCATLDLLNNIVKFATKSKTDISQYLLGGVEGIEWADKIINPEMVFTENKKEVEEVIKEAVEKFSLTADQIREILRNSLSEYKYISGTYEGNKYWVNTYDDEYVYIEDNESYKNYRAKYIITDLIATVDIDSKEEVIRGGFVPVGENSLEEQVEVKEEMSSDANTEATAQAELNEKEAENNKKLTDEGKEEKMEEEPNSEEVKEDMAKKVKEEKTEEKEDFKAMYEDIKAKFEKMESDLNSYMSENETLKKFKMDTEEKEKMSKVECCLSDVMESIPNEKMEELREDSKNFSLENLSIWENKVKAEAFSFSKGKAKDEGFTRMGLPYSEKSTKKGTGIWDNI